MPANNSCYTRVYVNDIVNRPDLGIVSRPPTPISSIGVLDKDVFDNEFYNVNKDYNRSTLGEYDSNGKWITNDAPPHEDYIATTYVMTLSPRAEYPGFDFICESCTNTGRVTNLQSPSSCSVFDPLAWVRHDIDNLPVTTDNPNAGRSVYKQRDHIRMDYGRYEGGVWVTKPVVFVNCIRQDNLRIVVATTHVDDWEFSFENGRLIAREEGYSDYLEPERNTTI